VLPGAARFGVGVEDDVAAGIRSRGLECADEAASLQVIGGGEARLPRADDDDRRVARGGGVGQG
jgi:hypothetical protein